MSIWDRFKKNNQVEEAEADPILLGQLERLEFRARPEFQAGLKNRLQASLMAQTALPVRPRRQFSLWRSPVPVGLGLAGMAAALVIVLSVLSVGTPAVDNTEPPLEGLVTPAALTAGPELVGGVSRFYNTSAQKYIQSDEAEKALGFVVRAPGFLPANYKLEYAGLQAQTEKSSSGSSLEASGYQLRYVAPALDATDNKAVRNQELEVYEWRVPFNLKLGPPPPGGPAGQSPPNPIGQNPPGFGGPSLAGRPPLVPSITGAQRSRPQEVQGGPGYLIEGARWRINMLMANEAGPAGLIETDLRLTPGNGQPGRAIAPPPARNRLASKLTFGRLMPTQPLYFIEFGKPEIGKRSDPKGVKTLIWQQGNTLMLVSATDNLSDEDLKQVADSLKVIGSRP